MPQFACPHCRILLQAGADLSEQAAVCPSCRGAIQFPKFKAELSEEEAEGGAQRLAIALAWVVGHVCALFLLALATGAAVALFVGLIAVVVEAWIWKRNALLQWASQLHDTIHSLLPASEGRDSTLPSMPPSSRSSATFALEPEVGDFDDQGFRFDDDLVEVRPANHARSYSPQRSARAGWNSIEATGRLEAQPLTTNAPRNQVAFFGMRSRLEVGRVTLESPLVYACGSAQYGQFDASLIDATLPVAALGSRPSEPLPYWPTYYDCSPAQRAHYLDWLMGGRRTANYELGYVFIYFYGLERRVLLDRDDFLPVAHELLSLLPVYSASNSFRRYAGSLLWRALLLASQAGQLSPQLLDAAIEATKRWNDDLLAMALATLVYLERPLPVALALAVCQNDSRSTTSVVIRRHQDEFRGLFGLKYESAYGEGVMLRTSKRTAKLNYQPASGTLLRNTRSSSGVQTFEVPNVLGLSSQFQPLVEIWEHCLDELKGYSRAVRKTDGELTAEVYESLPEELRNGDHPDFEAWMAVWESNVDEAGWPIVPASALAALKGIEPRGTLTKTQCTRLLTTADAVGLGVEPDTRITGKNYQWDERLALFFLDTDETCDDSRYLAASVLLRLAASVAQADGTIHPEELQFITEHLEGQFELSDADAKRLERLEYLLLHSQCGDYSVTKTLVERLTHDERCLLGEFLVGVAAVDEAVTSDEVQALRKAYRLLRLDEHELDELLARYASATVSPATSDQEASSGELHLDMAAVSRIMSETRRVATILREAMAETIDDQFIDVDPEQPTSPLLPTSGAQSTATSIPTAPTTIDGLDSQYVAFFSELKQQAEWSAVALRELADRCGVMVSGAVEALNEWSLDVHGDWLIEEGEPYRIRTDLLGEEA